MCSVQFVSDLPSIVIVVHTLKNIINRTTYTTQFGYNSSNDLTTLTDRRGKAWTFNYSNDAIQWEKDPLGHQTSYAYTSTATTITDANNHATVYTYNSNGQLASVKDALNYTESYGYDANNNRNSVTDKRGKVWGYTYDGRGNVLTKTDPLSHTWTYTYNSRNDVLTAQSPLSYTTTTTYDSNGNVATVSDPLSHVTTYTFNTNGTLGSVQDALSHTTTYGYDSNGYRPYVFSLSANRVINHALLKAVPPVIPRLRRSQKQFIAILPEAKYSPVTFVGQTLWDAHVRAFEWATGHVQTPQAALQEQQNVVQKELRFSSAIRLRCIPGCLPACARTPTWANAGIPNSSVALVAASIVYSILRS